MIHPTTVAVLAWRSDIELIFKTAERLAEARGMNVFNPPVRRFSKEEPGVRVVRCHPDDRQALTGFARDLLVRHA